MTAPGFQQPGGTKWFAVDIEDTRAGPYSYTPTIPTGRYSGPMALRHTFRHVQRVPIIAVDISTVEFYGDNIGVTDSVTKQADYDRRPTDPVGVTDSVATQIGFIRTQTDPVGVTDSAVFALALTYSYTPVVPTGRYSGPMALRHQFQARTAPPPPAIPMGFPYTFPFPLG